MAKYMCLYPPENTQWGTTVTLFFYQKCSDCHQTGDKTKNRKKILKRLTGTREEGRREKRRGRA